MKQNTFQKSAQIAFHANKSYSKVFGIGANKTGTTTLKTIFQIYGISTPVQQDQEARTVAHALRGDYRPLAELVRQYDAFQDQPFSLETVYVALDALFPGSRFILTARDPEKWYASMTRFHKKIFNITGEMTDLTEADVLEKFRYLYPGYLHMFKRRFLAQSDGTALKVRWDLLYDKEYYIACYERRNAEILRYFADRDRDFLQFDVGAHRTTEVLCDFLELPRRFIIDMPHANRS